MDTTTTALRCGFCFDREQGKHGAVKREYSPEWQMFIAVCRKHALADGMIDGKALPIAGAKAHDFESKLF